MDSGKILSAIEAIRRTLHMSPHGASPLAFEDAEKEMAIIRENCPPCAEKLSSLEGWLKVRFLPEPFTKFVRDPLHHVGMINEFALSDLSEIEAKVRQVSA